VHLLDFNGSLRGKCLRTLLASRLRPDHVFDSPEKLIEAMDNDLARARAWWGEAPKRAGAPESRI